MDDLFLDEVLSVIAAHDPATPFFLSWTPHGVHSPLEVPDAYLARFGFISDPRRRFYAAMVAHVDAMVGRVAAALKAKGMWEDVLWLTMADNGGPIYRNASFNANHPAHQKPTPPKNKPEPKPYHPLNPNQTGERGSK